MSTIKRKKSRRSTMKTINYVDLEHHRRWPNPLNLISYLHVVHSNVRSSMEDIERILNLKWWKIQRRQRLTEFDQIHRQEIQTDFRHQIDLAQLKFETFQDDFNEQNQIDRFAFSRFTEIIDQLILIHRTFIDSQKNIFQFRLDSMKNEFHTEKHRLRHIFVEQEFRRLDQQLRLIEAIDENQRYEEMINFRIEQNKVKEKFIEQINLCKVNFDQQSKMFRSSLDRIEEDHRQKIKSLSISCRRLMRKAEDFNERRQIENKFLLLLKRNIEQTKNRLEKIEENRANLHHRSKQINQCLDEKHRLVIQRTLLHKKDRCRQAISRLCSLVEHVQRQIQIKLNKTQLILRVAEQCHRLESQSECFITIDPTDRSQFVKNQNSSKIINELCCYSNIFPHDVHFKLLSMKIARVQYDIHILVQHKTNQKGEENLLRKKLNYFV